MPRCGLEYYGTSVGGSGGGENKVHIRRMRWLSKPSDEAYGSVVMFLRDHEDAQRLLRAGIMDIGWEMAYVRPYERRSLPMRCFKCQQYGHQEARCTAPEAHVRHCADTGHSVSECTSQNTRCAACQDPHKATDRGCPKYMELLRRFNLVNRHE